MLKEGLYNCILFCARRTHFSVIVVDRMYIKHKSIVELAFCRHEEGIGMAKWPDGPSLKTPMSHVTCYTNVNVYAQRWCRLRVLGPG